MGKGFHVGTGYVDMSKANQTSWLERHGWLILTLFVGSCVGLAQIGENYPPKAAETSEISEAIWQAVDEAFSEK